MPQRLCKTCNHPKPYHGRQLNMPSLPYNFKDGECCWGSKGRRVKLSKTKYRALVTYVLKRYTSGYKVSTRGVARTVEYRKQMWSGMGRRSAESKVNMMLSEAFPASLDGRSPMSVGLMSNNQLWVCGCKEFK